ASWPLTTAFTVAGYHRLPPCAVGTPSALSAAAILPRLMPDARSVTMRAATSAGNVDGRRAESLRPSLPPAPPLCAGGVTRLRRRRPHVQSRQVRRLHDLVARARSSDANCNEIRRHIRRLPGSLQRLPTGLRPDNHEIC